MGVAEALEYICELMSNGSKHKKSKKKQFQTVNLKIRMDCDGCELKVHKALVSLSGNALFSVSYIFPPPLKGPTNFMFLSNYYS